ncbi:MAG: FMN-binding negative transcriptional regulator [Ferrovibrio sp.]|uniref:FMN-binding negative transcriptional regulator n=1 Tax=Ferrovibrio sp. TaxID=1917215 RepID=UPI002601CA14|nr:FMN-binding negative transcriptional regulator [Ferrovibrio sp.]MCW0236685.1 FMN-binding negative transcriptional regulator [Ferrovibrio sp.]
MYIPAHFAQPNREAQFGLIEAHAFGQLISGSGPEMIASHVPFLLDRDRGAHGTLICHLAAANTQVAALDGQEVLCIFQGPHGYVSPNWYARKPAVPTWNYMVVHGYGRARVTRDAAALRGIVDRLSRIYEGPDGWKLDDEPDSFFDGLVRGIVGIEIPLTRLEGKYKLSQNRTLADIDGVIANLRRIGGDDNLALADAMAAAAQKKRGA